MRVECLSLFGSRRWRRALKCREGRFVLNGQENGLKSRLQEEGVVCLGMGMAAATATATATATAPATATATDCDMRLYFHVVPDMCQTHAQHGADVSWTTGKAFVGEKARGSCGCVSF
jgi:hypothetical protein